ncbi:MAG: chemotaxis protein CheW [Phormidesmis sp.]
MTAPEQPLKKLEKLEKLEKQLENKNSPRPKPTDTIKATALLQRTIPDSYRTQQTAQIAETTTQHRPSTALFTALIFRLGREWLALPAAICQQILSPVASHTLPQRSNSTLLGVVNVRGQLLLKVSLLEILGLPSRPALASSALTSTASEQTFRGYRRMIVAEKMLDGCLDVWAFEVDELYGVHSLSAEEFQPAATGISAVSSACTRHVFSWHNQQVNVLDDTKLFNALRLKAL